MSEQIVEDCTEIKSSRVIAAIAHYVGALGTVMLLPAIWLARRNLSEPDNGGQKLKIMYRLLVGLAGISLAAQVSTTFFLSSPELSRLADTISLAYFVSFYFGLYFWVARAGWSGTISAIWLFFFHVPYLILMGVDAPRKTKGKECASIFSKVL